MHSRFWPATAVALLATLGAAIASTPFAARSNDLRVLDGEWIFVE